MANPVDLTFTDRLNQLVTNYPSINTPSPAAPAPQGIGSGGSTISSASRDPDPYGNRQEAAYRKHYNDECDAYANFVDSYNK